ncbi:hypothetical protein PHYSODRAFT_524174 [Phytophthora sojae]|uniref:Uncharacterized protein n=1 Tax=Phytophthora sojae (strain P6497) TaxID=1094619 RepID=G5A5K9_PHYSP|nr:hypothetical protein PHYSODRAFT_524174 [Phytophthora sojae]EGZ08614.1 hypothetical protein PHYSODRAFT_524174 [Phytophthora sojae]|eukprot:XP_009535247.1 hypothetical protein PHYSODRAFT_524174 [Phytophthora sojae]
MRALQYKCRPEKLFRGSLFDSEAAIFDSLRVELETQYQQTDNVFRSTGLAHFEGDMAARCFRSASTPWTKLLPEADTLVTVWLTVKRFYEWSDDGRKRIICVWNAMTCMRISPLGRAEFDPSDVAVGTLANVLVGCYHRTVIVMHHVLEKLLLVEDTRSLLG